MISNTELLIIQNLIKELDALYQIAIQPDNQKHIENLAKDGKIRFFPLNNITMRETSMKRIREAIRDGLIIIHANGREMECGLDYAN